MHHWTVSPQESGMKLQAFLKLKLGDTFSSRQIKQAIESNRCKVNKRTERFATALVGTGDQISLHIETTAQPTPICFETARVLYEDDALLIYDKPPGIASDNEFFLQVLKRTNHYLALVHRLDKETSGVLIFAKTEICLAKMMQLFKQRLINKTYLAIVDGRVETSSGVIDNYLGELKRYQGQTLWGSVPKGKGMHALTAWTIEQKGPQATLLRCFPKTGRTHQIRVHMSEMGHPILGDFQYGKNFICSYRPERCMLHALEVSFIHPETNKKMTIVAQIPADFVKAMESVLK